MHELSIANSLVEIASEYAEENGVRQIKAITLRLGALSCVHKSALEFSFDLVAKETPLEGAELRYVDVPVAIFCQGCNDEVELPGIQIFRCPRCGASSGDVRRGQELEIESIEVAAEDPAEV